MIKNILFSISMLLLIIGKVSGQELQAKVTINAQKVYNTIDKKIFTTLQSQLTNLLNTRKWTSDVFQPKEKIQCSFLINIDAMEETNVFKAALVVQAARPIYNAAYQSPLVNFQDADVTFKYVEFQPIEFNENRVQGTDALAANLTATLAYYVYLIIAMDYDSFSPKGGTVYFQKMLNIVNNAPEASKINGWRSFDGIRNRYWLADNTNNSRYNIIHDIIYTYYRSGLDNMYDNAVEARKSVLEALTRLHAFNQENPNTMILQFLMQNRSQEIIGIFKKATPQEKARLIELVATIDVANIAVYKQELK